jgi:hypothetical protein
MIWIKPMIFVCSGGRKYERSGILEDFCGNRLA